MVVQLFPQDFIVEDQPGLRDPRNMLAQRLEANAHLITGSIQQHTSLIGAVNQAHIVVEETVYEPVAAHFASVMPETWMKSIPAAEVISENWMLDSLALRESTTVSGAVSRAASRTS